MKAIFCGFAAALFFVILFSSCQREIDWNIYKPADGDSTLLDRFVYLDTTFPAPFDTFAVDKFVYDANKRVIRQYWIEVDGPISDTTSKWQHYYNGNDSLPYKVEYYGTFFGSLGLMETSFIFYNSNGLVIKDSTLFVGGVYQSKVTNYAYLSNGIRDWGYYVDPVNGNIPFADTTYQTRIGRNVLLQADTAIDNNGLPAWVRLDYRYDNHPNPFRKVFMWMPPIYFGEDVIDENFSENNWTETFSQVTRTFPAVDDDHSTYTYVYGSNGMPKICRELFFDAMGNEVYKYVYFYTK